MPRLDAYGKTALVTGASSVVGHYVAQILTQAGARVLGTVGSAEKARHAQNAGVRVMINYKTEPVAERLKALTGGNGFELIVDIDFSMTSTWLSGVWAPHGTLVSYGSNVIANVRVNFRSLLRISLTLKFFLVYALLSADSLVALLQLDILLRSKQLQHTLGDQFALADIARAHEVVEAGREIGNVVLTL